MSFLTDLQLTCLLDLLEPESENAISIEQNLCPISNHNGIPHVGGIIFTRAGLETAREGLAASGKTTMIWESVLEAVEVL